MDGRRLCGAREVDDMTDEEGGSRQSVDGRFLLGAPPAYPTDAESHSNSKKNVRESLEVTATEFAPRELRKTQA